MFGDFPLLDDPRRALERVSEPQQPPDLLGRLNASFKLKDLLAELIQQFARFEPKISVGSAAMRPGPISLWPDDPREVTGQHCQLRRRGESLA